MLSSVSPLSAIMLHLFLNQLVIPPWIATTDEVTYKSSKEELCTKNHCDECYKEGRMI